LPWSDELDTSAKVGNHLRGIVERILGFGGGKPRPRPSQTVYLTIDAPPGVTVDVQQVEHG
jgi:hypothetical protein